jgi:TrmH family RNA methyltransferase
LLFVDELGIRYEENDRIVNTLGREDTYFVGVFSKYESKLKSGESIVLLYHPSDLGNLGTIMRTCLGFGIKNVAIIEPATDIFDPKVIRSSMGALFSLNFMHFREIEEFKEYYDQPMYILDIKGEKDISSVKFEKPCTLVFGNEGKGVEDKVLSLGTPVRISHRDDIDSLNLAVSVGIALYAYSESK